MSILPIKALEQNNINENKNENINLDSNIYNKMNENNKSKINKNKIDYKEVRLFFGINHIKIFIDKIKNINKDTNLIIDSEQMKTIDINMKILKKTVQDNNNKNNLIIDNSSEIFSSKDLIEKKIQYINSLKQLSIKQENNEEEEESEKDLYYYRNNYNLSAFHIDNLKKSQNLKDQYSNKYIINNKNKSVDFYEKKLIDIYNYYELNKNNFLSLRKNITFLRKREFEQLKNKIRNIEFHNNNRFDNIDEDKDKEEIEYNYIKEVNYNNKKNKRYESALKEKINDNNEKQQREYSLSKAIINPNDNLDFSLYYYPRAGSKLLIKK